MAQQVFKILNATDVNLLTINGGVSRINSMTIANVGSGSATVDLYLKNAANTLYYIFKVLVLPVGQTLKLEGNEVSFDGKIYGLWINLAGTTPVDVIIN